MNISEGQMNKERNRYLTLLGWTTVITESKLHPCILVSAIMISETGIVSKEAECSGSGARRGYRGRLSKEQMLDILADMGPPSSYQWEKTDICDAHQWVEDLKEQEKQHPVDNNVAY